MKKYFYSAAVALVALCAASCSQDADDFSDVFLDKGGVAVVPCTGFGAPYFTRWSFAVSMETIKEGLDRLEKFLAGAGIQ